MKKCKFCKKNFRLENVYKTNSSLKSEQYICRNCNRIKVKRYRHTVNGKAVYREIMKRQYHKHKEKVKARQRVRYAILKGVIIKPENCSICYKKVNLEGHHKNYKKPLIVIWVCRDCHRKIDK